MKYSLTIAIPTYNRAAYLENQLCEILRQLKEYDDIEILISDNCSTDQTESVVRNHKQSFINYYKQSQNLGLDVNVLSCYEKAKGKYIWFLSDDDTIFDDAISRVYNFISVHDFSVLTFSF